MKQIIIPLLLLATTCAQPKKKRLSGVKKMRKCLITLLVQSVLLTIIPMTINKKLNVGSNESVLL